MVGRAGLRHGRFEERFESLVATPSRRPTMIETFGFRPTTSATGVLPPKINGPLRLLLFFC